MALWNFFDFFKREVNSINISLRYSSLKATSKRLGEKKVYLVF